MTEIIDFKETENPLFKRKEISLVVSSEFTPSVADISKIISEKMSIAEDVLKVKKISSGFGKSEFNVEANVYDSAESKEEYEKKTKQEKEAEKKAAEDAVKAKEEAEKAEAAPVETPAEEKPVETPAPAEEKKEEAPKKETKTEEKKE